MVCQAASQTRFRALKHENGIPGRSTIVVRVIACFQPLQNCQAKYFRQLLKPVTAEESQTCQQFSAWNSKDSNHLASPVPKDGVAGLSQAQNPSLGVLDEPVDAPRKRFIIFDRSGNRTRCFVSPSFSRQNNTVASEARATSGVLCGKVASGVEEKWGENDLNDGDGEMPEDAEEIDALLCSDSDDDANDGTDSDNDEVSSTRHAPLGTEDREDKGESRAGNGDGSPKRRKLLDGSSKKPSFGSNEGASSCDYNSAGKNEKTAKIRGAMEVLGGMIPGLSSKDPLSIIEEAIVYLEAMKMEAMAVQVFE